MLTICLPRHLEGKGSFLTLLPSQALLICQRQASIPKAIAEVIDLTLIDNPEVYSKSAAELKRSLLSVL